MKNLSVTLALFAAAVVAYGQTVAGLCPIGGQFFDASGHPLAGGKIYSYLAGTSTAAATYTDSTGGTPATNPIILDSGGRADVWLSATAYKLVLKTSADVTVHTWDGLTAPTLGTASITIPSGQSLTMASGSSTSLATSLLPSGASRNLGSGAAHWSQAHIDFLTLYNSLSLAATASYDSGSPSKAWNNTYAFSGYVNKQYFCGSPWVAPSNCWSMTPHVNSSDSYMVMADEAGTEVFRWSKKEGGATTNTITFPVGWNAKVPGTVTTGMLNLSGIAHINTGSLSGDVNGTISLSSSATGAHTFANAYAFAPNCIVAPSSDPGAFTYWVTTTTGAVTVHLSAPGTLIFSYLCLSGN